MPSVVGNGVPAHNATQAVVLSSGRLLKLLATAALICWVGSLLSAQTSAPTPVVGQNVNVLSPAQDSFQGDVFERQVETDIAVSPVNPSRAMAGFITYQTLNSAIGASSWCGYSITNNGGKTWRSKLLLGFPQDTAQTAPLYGLAQCVDPVLAAGPPTATGPAHIYYGGLGMTKGLTTKAFVSRFSDPDDGTGNLVYEGAVVVDSGNYSFQGQVLDKPAITVDPPSPGFDQGIIHFTYVVFNGTSSTDFRTKVLYVRSIDGGKTFSKPVKLNDTFNKNNGTAIARTNDGTIYVFWRTFLQENGIQVVRITRSGGISKPTTIAGGTNFYAYDHPSSAITFRSNAFPTATADANNRLYVAWQELVDSSGVPAPLAGSVGPRIVLSSSADGTTWALRRAVEVGGPYAHQFQPDLAAGGGLVSLLFWDARNDGRPLTGGYFAGRDRRMELHIAQAVAGAGTPVFGDSTEVSRYDTYADESGGGKPAPRPGYTKSTFDACHLANPTRPYICEAVNLPNLSSTSNGTAAFIGDYVGMVSAREFVRENGAWRLALQPGDLEARTFYASWPDTRLAAFPGSPGAPDINGVWKGYTPGADNCVNPGTRNTKPFFAAISPGVVARWSGTSHPLTGNANAFALSVENQTVFDRYFRIRIIDGKSLGGSQDWSFVQPPATMDSNVVDLQILRQSAFTRGVYYRSSSITPTSPVAIQVDEIDAQHNLLSGGLKTTITVTMCELSQQQAWCGALPASYGLGLTEPSVKKLPNVKADKLQPHNFGFENFGFENFGFENFGFENFGFENFGFENFGFENSPPGDYDVSYTVSGSGLQPTSGNAFANVEGAQAMLDGGYMFRLFVYATNSTPALNFGSGGACPTNGQLLQDQIISTVPIAQTNSSEQLVGSFGFENFGFENFGFENFGFENSPPSDITNAAFVADPQGVKLTLRSYKKDGAPSLYTPDTNSGLVSQSAVSQSLNTGVAARPVAFYDTTPPVIVPVLVGTLGNNGWYVSDVAVTWKVSDPGSGIASSSGCDAVTITAEGQTILTCSATNAAGLPASQQVTVKIDKTPPTITITTPAVGGSYLLNATVASVVACKDSISGVASCTYPASVPTGTVGRNTLTASAVDNAGKTAQASVDYFVEYKFVLGALKITANLGSAVPVTWQLLDAVNGAYTNLSSLKTLTAYFNGAPGASGCVASATGTPIPIFTPVTGWTGNSNLRITASNQFQLNWDTTTAVPLGMGCYTLHFGIEDNPTKTEGRLVSVRLQ